MRRTVAATNRAALAMLSLAVASRSAFASPRADPAPSRFFVGVGPGLIDASLSVGRLDEADQHGDFVAAVEAGYGRLLVGSWFGLTAIGRYGLWQDGWAQLAGERRTRFDVWLGPELRFALAVPLSPVVSIAAGAGPTFARITPMAHHRVTESFALGWGLNTGLRAAFAARVFGLHGIYVFADGSLHITQVVHRIAAPNGGRVVEQYRFVDRQVLAGGGYMLEF